MDKPGQSHRNVTMPSRCFIYLYSFPFPSSSGALCHKFLAIRVDTICVCFFFFVFRFCCGCCWLLHLQRFRLCSARPLVRHSRRVHHECSGLMCHLGSVLRLPFIIFNSVFLLLDAWLPFELVENVKIVLRTLQPNADDATAHIPEKGKMCNGIPWPNGTINERCCTSMMTPMQ